MSKKKVLREIFDLNRGTGKRILKILIGVKRMANNCNKYYWGHHMKKNKIE